MERSISPIGLTLENEAGGTWKQGRHFYHVKTKDSVLFLVLIIGRSPDCGYCLTSMPYLSRSTTRF